MSGNNKNNWTSVITSERKLFRLNLRELVQYKDLLFLFVKRDITAQYKQTILGPLWFFIQPLLTTFVFTIIFGKVAKLPSDGIPHILFYLSGIIVWNYFSQCAITTSNTFISNRHIFTKVYFPRLITPLSIAVSKLIQFFIQFAMFLLVISYYYIMGLPVNINPILFMLPLLIFQMGLLGLSVGIIISSMTTKYRDLSFLVGFGMQLWMYATPVVYPQTMVPEKWQFIYSLNPMVSVIRFFKYGFFGTGEIDWFQYGTGVVVTFLLLFTGIMIFNWVERTFVDTI